MSKTDGESVGFRGKGKGELTGERSEVLKD